MADYKGTTCRLEKDTDKFGVRIVGTEPPEIGKSVEVEAKSGNTWETTIEDVIRVMEDEDNEGVFIFFCTTPPRESDGEISDVSFAKLSGGEYGIRSRSELASGEEIEVETKAGVVRTVMVLEPAGTNNYGDHLYRVETAIERKLRLMREKHGKVERRGVSAPKAKPVPKPVEDDVPF